MQIFVYNIIAQMFQFVKSFPKKFLCEIMQFIPVPKKGSPIGGAAAEGG